MLKLSLIFDFEQNEKMGASWCSMVWYTGKSVVSFGDFYCGEE